MIICQKCLAHFHTSFTKRRNDSSELTTETRVGEGWGGNNETYKSIRSDGRRRKNENIDAVRLSVGILMME